MAKSPLEQVKEKFGDKTKLVAAIRQLSGDELWVNRANGSKGLDHVSNTKLLKLHSTFSLVKDNFGSRAKLVSAIAELEGRGKDEGYQTRLSAWPVPRLYDHFRSTKKRLAAPARKAAASAARAEGAAAAKAAAPAAAAKPTAAKGKAAAAKPAAAKGASKKGSAAKPAAKKASSKAGTKGSKGKKLTPARGVSGARCAVR